MVTEFCDGASLESDWEFVEPQSLQEGQQDFRGLQPEREK